MTKAAKRSYKFGEYRLDAAEGLLLRHAEAVLLPPKVIDVLLLLVENHGRLVEKDEFMQRLWPDTYVGDDTLAKAISLARKALGDSGNGQGFIVTVPKRGYRFVAEVQEAVEASPGAQGPAVAHVPQISKREELLAANPPAGRPTENNDLVVHGAQLPASQTTPGFRVGRLGVIAAAGTLGLLAGYLTFLFLSPAPTPKVTRITQITRSGRVDPWARMVSDGSRIYFLEREGDHWNLAQTSVTGGETQLVATPFRNTLVLDISPDNSEFLIAAFTSRETLMPLWIWPVQGGAPRRVGNILAYNGVWCPKGSQIIYSELDGLYMVERDGTNPRKFASTDGLPSWFSWSPDGRVLRFSVFGSEPPSASIWEIDADGTHLHRVFPSASNPPDGCCGTWAADGRYFFFQSGRTTDIWTTREKRRLLQDRVTGPVRLTAGPHSLSDTLPSKDGRKLYAIGTNVQYDLVRYDLKSHEFTSVFSALGASNVAYSKTGDWLTYVSMSDSTLWRMKSDGSGRLPLTSPRLSIVAPAWSPDGKQIAFEGWTSGRSGRLYLVSSEGGSPKELFPDDRDQGRPAWSPDGKFIAFDRADSAVSTAPAFGTHIFSFATHQVSRLPGTIGTLAPSWSPDGRFIAAISEDLHKVMVFDFQTSRWTDLASGSLLSGPARWSPDGKYLYFQDLLAVNEPVYRLRLSDHKKKEVVASFETYLQNGIPRCGFIGLAPDGSLIVALLHNNADIYALDVELP
jgi:DNA-binding winged helix-turn-helix (wHTH) protein/Tol biopolymer transport system component